jgi:hypothetical protein
MENSSRLSSKASSILCYVLVVLLVLAGYFGFLTGRESGLAEGREAMAAQNLPASPQLAPTPPSTPGPSGESYSLSGVFFLGNQIAGTTNFSPSDIASGDCRVTPRGQGEKSMTLVQELGDTKERNSALFEVYASGSVIKLTNTRLVPGDNPHIVSDARIVPQGITAPFPAYLEVKQAKFKWALPGVENADGQVGDPLIVCNYV